MTTYGSGLYGVGLFGGAEPDLDLEVAFDGGFSLAVEQALTAADITVDAVFDGDIAIDQVHHLTVNDAAVVAVFDSILLGGGLSVDSASVSGTIDGPLTITQNHILGDGGALEIQPVFEGDLALLQDHQLVVVDAAVEAFLDGDLALQVGGNLQIHDLVVSTFFEEGALWGSTYLLLPENVVVQPSFSSGELYLWPALIGRWGVGTGVSRREPVRSD